MIVNLNLESWHLITLAALAYAVVTILYGRLVFSRIVNTPIEDWGQTAPPPLGLACVMSVISGLIWPLACLLEGIGLALMLGNQPPENYPR